MKTTTSYVYDNRLRWKAALALILAVALAAVIVTADVGYAEDPADTGDGTETAVTSGTCGTDLKWELVQNEDGNTYTLKITGNGTEMDDYNGLPPTGVRESPWQSFASEITDIELPSQLTKIGARSFTGTNITSIEIPSSVTVIGTSAFWACQNLASVNFEDLTSLTTIGGSAFESTAVPVVDLSNTELTTIAAGAFQYNDDLTTVKIPATVTSFQQQAFSGCDSLVTLEIPTESQLTTIGNSALWSTGFTTLDLSNATGLNSIGSFAFQDCEKLQSITFPDIDALTINNLAFDGTTSLASLDLSGISSLTINGDRTFRNSGLQSIDLSDTNLTSIPDQAFYGCSSLTTVTLPTSLTSIGDSAFVNSGLQSIDLSETSVTSIPYQAFWFCESLSDVKLPSRITSIGTSAFCRCTSLTEFDFNSLTSLASIGASAFEGSGIIVADLSKTQLTTIMDGAFHYNDSLTTVILPKTVTNIKPQSFNYCENLTTLTIPDNSGLTTIGSNAFEGTGLTELDLSNASSLNNIANGAFGSCGSLTKVTLPSSITTVPTGAFNGSPVSEIIIHGSCTVIFNPNGGTGSQTFQTITNGSGTLDANAFTRTGYTFARWNTAADGTGTDYADNSTFVVGEGVASVVLYAQWTPITYTVEFNSNGGTGTMANMPMTYDFPANLSSNAFTYDGHAFAGWNTAADGNGTAYTDGQEVSNLASTSGATVTLYAQWKVTHTVTFKVDREYYHSVTVIDGDELTSVPTPPEKDGFIFMGWFEGNTHWEYLGPITEDHVLEAEYIEIETDVIHVEGTPYEGSHVVLSVPGMTVFVWGYSTTTDYYEAVPSGSGTTLTVTETGYYWAVFADESGDPHLARTYVEFSPSLVNPPIFDDDDDYVPPIYVPSGSSSSDDDTVKIVACAAAAVVAAIMAAFLILGHRRE